MNINLIKYYLKKDLTVTIGYILSISITIFAFGQVIDYKQDFWDYIGAINSGFPIVTFGYFMMIYFPILNKTTADQWENFSLTKNEKFNLLAIRYCVSMLIPQILMAVLAQYISFGITSITIWSYITLILLPIMTYVFAMYFTFVSGHVAVAVIGGIFGAIIAEVILSLSEWTNIEPRLLWAGCFVLACLLIYVNRKIFENRAVEKLGRMFLFRWAEIACTVAVTALVTVILTGATILNGTTILEYIFVTTVSILAYVLNDIVFITGLKIEKLKIKLSAIIVLKKCAIGAVISIFISFLIASSNV